MRAVVQRVNSAAVSVAGIVVGEIGPGLMVLLGVGSGDDEQDALYLAGKIANLRIFADGDGKMNLSVQDTQGEMLAISQFTLYGDCRQGRRPGFSQAASAEEADRLYEKFVQSLRDLNLSVETGVFQTHMVVTLENDGPVTMILDSRKQF